jgi:hypothetical protein
MTRGALVNVGFVPRNTSELLSLGFLSIVAVGSCTFVGAVRLAALHTLPVFTAKRISRCSHFTRYEVVLPLEDVVTTPFCGEALGSYGMTNWGT